MTEYDYSPAAYNRYIESQSRVGRWVDNANEHAREYVNPFVPSNADPAEKSDFYASSSSSHRRSKSAAVKQSTPRSLEVPEQHRVRDYSHRSSSSRDHHHRPSNTRSSSSSSSSSATYTARPYSSRSYTLPQHPPAHGVRAPLQPTRSRTMPHGYHYEQGNEIMLPPMRPGQTYVIIPPHGKPVNVVSTDGSHVIQQPYHTSPTKEQPLIKRLFGLGSNAGSQSSSRVHGAASGGKPRRTHSRRTSY